MTRVFIRLIEKCLDCPSCDWDICRKKGKRVDIYSLPKFCPLPKIDKDHYLEVSMNEETEPNCVHFMPFEEKCSICHGGRFKCYNPKNQKVCDDYYPKKEGNK